MSDLTDGLDTGFSLADLAEIDVSEIAEVRFVSIPAGGYTFEVIKADLFEDTKDGARRFKAEFDLKILEVKAVLEPNVDKDALVGKVQTERFFVKAADTQEDVLKSFGRIRAFVTDMGLNSAGKLGDIVRNAKGHIFDARIASQPNKDDPANPYKRLRLDPRKD